MRPELVRWRCGRHAIGPPSAASRLQSRPRHGLLPTGIESGPSRSPAMPSLPCDSALPPARVAVAHRANRRWLPRRCPRLLSRPEACSSTGRRSARGVMVLAPSLAAELQPGIAAAAGVRPDAQAGALHRCPHFDQGAVNFACLSNSLRTLDLCSTKAVSQAATLPWSRLSSKIVDAEAGEPVK